MKSIVFISDYYESSLLGGAELNDSVLITYLKSKKINVILLESSKITDEQIIKNNFFIISNFTHLTERHKIMLQQKKYIIYEHDHKYVSTRDPSKFINFAIPKDKIINFNFYCKAYKIIVLSEICKKIIEDTLGVDNVINIGTSLWSEDTFSFLENLLKIKKTKQYFIINSANPIKGTLEAKFYAHSKKIEYDLLDRMPPKELFKKMAEYENFIFVPRVLETYSRITMEAKMLGCKIHTNRLLLGASYEEYFHLNGKKLIDVLREKVSNSLEIFYRIFEENEEIKNI